MSNDIPMLFKFTRSDGRPPQQMNYDGKKWSLPTKNPDGTWTPGDVWDTGATEAIHCTPTALHATDVDDIRQWFSDGARLFQIEFLDTPTKAQGKWAGTKARLLREIDITPEFLTWLRNRNQKIERQWLRSNWVREKLDRESQPLEVQVIRAALIARLDKAKADLGPLYDEARKATEAFTHEAHLEWVESKDAAYLKAHYPLMYGEPFRNLQKEWRRLFDKAKAYQALYHAYSRMKAFGDENVPKLPVEQEEARLRYNRICNKVLPRITYGGTVRIDYGELMRDEDVPEIEAYKKFRETRQIELEAEWEAANPVPAEEFDVRAFLGITKSKRGV